MKRREFIKLGGGVAASWPLVTRAQQRIPIVGFVGFANAVTVNAFRKALIGFGHVEGRTIIVNTRSANGGVSRGHAMIDELVALPVDVFLSPGPAAARAIVRKTNIPVVAVALPAVQSDPELFQSLSRPGGTVTGFSAFGEEISAKRIEMLKEIVPGLKKLGVMQPSSVQLTEQIMKLADNGGTAMIVIRDFLTVAMMKDICRIAADARIAVIGEHAEIARAGALFSYGADLSDLFRRAAGYVDNILKGGKPAEMPIQLPTKFELIANIKVARILGLTFPASILVLADQVIE